MCHQRCHYHYCYHHPSSIIIHHHPSLSIIIHHHRHPSSSIIIHRHPSSSITIHHHPSSSIIIHHRPSTECTMFDAAISDAAIVHIGRSCARLRILNLAGCTSLTACMYVCACVPAPPPTSTTRPQLQQASILHTLPHTPPCPGDEVSPHTR